MTNMERLAVRDPEIRDTLNEHKHVCLDMGYDAADFDEAVKDLISMGMW